MGSAPSALTLAQLTGRDESHLVDLEGGHRLQSAVAEAFAQLQTEAGQAGFELAIASSFRSFERQCAIWNGKACGERAVHDDHGKAVDMASLAPAAQAGAILRFSALPGTSRHHWGTDLDVYDAAAMPSGYQLQLSPAEVAPGGLFDPLHRWLDARMAEDRSFGFFRPYLLDRGGVAPERWHLSFAPLALACEAQCESAALATLLADEPVTLWRDVLAPDWRAVFERYVAVAQDWCPAAYR